MINQDDNKGSVARVLVVEDDVVSRLLLNEILKEMGLSITFARNGQEAVNQVISEGDTIDFILMDLKMPILNGFEATTAIRELGFVKPIIAQTAYASKEDQEKVSSGGFDAYISKPVKKDLLLDILKQLNVLR
ncbi:MAG: response regulator [Tenuifilaceae bacterium]|jgi:CheY-like chemotaxis protein|nr:response regulator [Tenuifilaceae bacterium]